MARKSTGKSSQQKNAERRERVGQLMDALDRFKEEQGPDWAPPVVLKAASPGEVYSGRNSQLLAMQCEERGMPAPTMAAGYNDWLALGRQVRKGETALRVLRPGRLSKAKEEAIAEAVENGEEVDVRRRYYDAPTFDRSQTEPVEASQPAEPVEAPPRTRNMVPAGAGPAYLAN